MVRVVIASRSRVLAPAGLQGFGDRLWLCELEMAGFFRDDGTFRLWLQLGNKLGDEAANLLRVQVTSFLRDIHKRGEDLVMTLLGSFGGGATRSANFYRKLFTVGVTNKLTWLFLYIASGACTLVNCFALLRT